MDELLRESTGIGNSKSHRFSSVMSSHSNNSSNKFANDGVTRYKNSQAARWTGQPQIQAHTQRESGTEKTATTRKQSTKTKQSDSSSDDDLLLTDNSSLPGTPIKRVTPSHDSM